MERRKRFLGLGLIILLLCMPVFLGISQAKQTIGMTGDFKNEYHMRSLTAAKDQAAIFGIDAMMLDTKRDPGTEIRNIEQFIASKVNAIIAIHSNDSVYELAIGKANQAKIPFVAFLDCPPKGDFIYAGSNYVQGAGGEIAAEALAKAMNYSGNIVYIRGTPGVIVSINRDKGLQAALKKYPKLKVVVELEGDWTRATGLKIMEDALAKYPQSAKNGGVSGVYAINDAMALGAVRAIQTAGRKDIKVVGIDGALDAIDAIQAGTMTATAYQNAEAQGVYAVVAAFRAMKGEKVPQFGFNIPWGLVTPETAAKFKQAQVGVNDALNFLIESAPVK